MNRKLIELLKEARINRNMKQRDVADLLGIQHNTLSNWENGRTEPDMDTFIKMCKIYKVDFTSLMSRAYGIEKNEDKISFEEIVKAYDNNRDLRILVDQLLYQLLKVEFESKDTKTTKASSSKLAKETKGKSNENETVSDISIDGNTVTDPEIASELSSYVKELESEKRAKEESSVLHDTKEA